jgi:hypothetical protein
MICSIVLKHFAGYTYETANIAGDSATSNYGEADRIVAFLTPIEK